MVAYEVNGIGTTTTPEIPGGTRNPGSSPNYGPVFRIHVPHHRHIMAVFIKGALQTAVEEGVRTGITETLVSGTTYLTDSIAQSVVNNSKGYINTAKPTCVVNV